MESAASEKTALRLQFKDVRRKQSEGQRAQAALRLQENLLRFLGDFADVQRCLYMATAFEAPCQPGEPSCDFFYPVMKGANDLEFWQPASRGAFKANAVGIQEPIPEKSTPMNLAVAGVVCCPAVGVDRNGIRLGMGRGYYDRFFSAHPHLLRVGVVFQIQVSHLPLPAESWDQAVDWIVTDEMILRTSSPTRSSQSWI